MQYFQDESPEEVQATANPTGSSAAYPKVTSEEKEELWRSVFAEPNAWWDNRVGKRNPNAPDYKKKGDGLTAGLWLNNKDTPAWVHQRLSEDRAEAEVF